jgi:excisionase family DNA binding protein
MPYSQPMASEPPTPEQPPPKMRVRDVVAFYGLSERHVRALVADRKVPFYKVGTVLLFDRADFDAWFEAQRVESI